MDPSRRAVLGGTAALAALFSTRAEGAPPRTRLASLKELNHDEPRVLEYPKGHQVMLLKLGREADRGIGPERDIVCFSMRCTHLGCPVAFRRGRLACPCHFSQFDPALRGQCFQGPAHENLPQIQLELDGDDLSATGILGLVWGHTESPA